MAGETTSTSRRNCDKKDSCYCRSQNYFMKNQSNCIQIDSDEATEHMAVIVWYNMDKNYGFIRSKTEDFFLMKTT